MKVSILILSLLFSTSYCFASDLFESETQNEVFKSLKKALAKEYSKKSDDFWIKKDTGFRYIVLETVDKAENKNKKVKISTLFTCGFSEDNTPYSCNCDSTLTKKGDWKVEKTESCVIE